MTETLVLVPGLNCTARLFEPQIAALRAGREILIADHARDDTMAAIARRLLDRAPERFALAGLSMGGYIALEVMHQAPERVARLALLDTNARADTDEQRLSREREIALAEGDRFAQVCEARWARSVLAGPALGPGAEAGLRPHGGGDRAGGLRAPAPGDHGPARFAPDASGHSRSDADRRRRRR